MKRITIYISVLSLLLCFQKPAVLFADYVQYTNDQDDRRTQLSYVIAGLTIIGLGGAIAYAASQSGHHGHHSSGSSSSSSYYTYYDSYDHSHHSKHHHHHHNHHKHHHHHSDHHHHHHHSSSGSYSIFSYNDVSSFGDSSSSESSIIDPLLLPRTKKIKKGQRKEEAAQQMSGLFISHPNPSAQGQGHMVPYVQLPDGTHRQLGRIPLNSQTSTSLPYGPFDQKGTYTFGVKVEQSTSAPHQIKIGSVDIDVNGSTMQRHDFILPPHSTHEEPSTHSFDM